MATNMMIDLETLDTRPSAVVFQVGFTIFDNPLENREWTILEKGIWHLDILEQIMKHRTISDETVQWWMTQNEQAWIREAEGISLYSQFIMRLTGFCALHQVNEVWSNSPSFDAVILRSLHESMGSPMKFPFSFRQDRDLRTLKKILGGDPPASLNVPVVHNALRDAEDQTFVLGHYMSRLRDLTKDT